MFPVHVATIPFPNQPTTTTTTTTTTTGSGKGAKDVLALSRGISARDALACCRSSSNKLKQAVLETVNTVIESILNPPSSHLNAQLAMILPSPTPEPITVFRPPEFEPIVFKPPPDNIIRIEWTKPIQAPGPQVLVLLGASVVAKYLYDSALKAAALEAAVALAEAIQKRVEEQGTCEGCLRPKVWSQNSQKVQLDLPRKTYRKRPRKILTLPKIP